MRIILCVVVSFCCAQRKPCVAHEEEKRENMKRSNEEPKHQYMTRHKLAKTKEEKESANETIISTKTDLKNKAENSTTTKNTVKSKNNSNNNNKNDNKNENKNENNNETTSTIKHDPRMVDGMKCGYKICGKIIDTNSDAAQVATNVKLYKKISEKEKDKLECEWTPGRVAFHHECWEKLYERYTQAVNNSKAVGGGTGNKETMNKKELNIIGSAGEVVEFFDGCQKVEEKVEKILELVKAANHLTAFTGAGISTSAGISDYRGTLGVDTKQHLGQIDEEEEDVPYEKLIPTLTHKVLSKLAVEGKLKYIISQNCDNLHMKSGTPKDSLAELHGNVFVEYCEKCFKEFTRDYCVDLWSTDCHKEKWYVKCPTCGHNHYTSRKCDDKKCKGKLRDTIINFGDLLHDKVCGGLPRSKKESKESDLMLCLGSSLTVSPADSLCLLPTNIVETPMDKKAIVRVFATCDHFMKIFHTKFYND